MHAGTTQRHTARILLVLWGLISLGNVVFRHAHRLPDGRLISHVHPYTGVGNKCPFPNHKHTQTELAWLECIGNAPVELPVFDVVCPLPTVWLVPHLPYAYVGIASGPRFFDHHLRGPPSRVG